MTLGNCWTYALKARRDHGGSLIVRRSLGTWVPHAFHALAGVGKDLGLMYRVTLPMGLRMIMGPGRGYLVCRGGRYWWTQSIEKAVVSEYVPRPWAYKLAKAWAILRVFPVHVILFKGLVRIGRGEGPEARRIIERTWPRYS